MFQPFSPDHKKRNRRIQIDSEPVTCTTQQSANVSAVLLQAAMPGMKHDCGGAAAVLGAFYAAVKQVSAHPVLRSRKHLFFQCSSGLQTKPIHSAKAKILRERTTHQTTLCVLKETNFVFVLDCSCSSEVEINSNFMLSGLH